MQSSTSIASAPGFLLSPNIYKLLDKANQHLKVLEQASPQTMVLCVNVEAWEQRTEICLEVGISIATMRELLAGRDDRVDAFHWIVKGNLDKKNRKMVPDHRESLQLGDSVVMSSAAVALQINNGLDEVRKSGLPVLPVGHPIAGDEKWLKDAFGIDIPHQNVCDVALVDMALRLGSQPRKLEAVCQTFAVQCV